MTLILIFRILTMQIGMPLFLRHIEAVDVCSVEQHVLFNSNPTQSFSSRTVWDCLDFFGIQLTFSSSKIITNVFQFCRNTICPIQCFLGSYWTTFDKTLLRKMIFIFNSLLMIQTKEYCSKNYVKRYPTNSSDSNCFYNKFLNKPFKCVILLYSTPGLPDATAVKNHARNVSVVCKTDNITDVLMSMLEQCIPWTQKLVFRGTDSRYVTPLIERFMQTNQCGKYYIVTHDQLEIDRKTLVKTITNLPPIPEGIYPF